MEQTECNCGRGFDCTCGSSQPIQLSLPLINEARLKAPGFKEQPNIHPTESKSPLQCRNFRKFIEEMYQTHLDKNCDYSPANIVVMGEIGVLVRIWDKFCRLCNLYGITVPSVAPMIDDLIETIKKPDNSLDQSELIGRLEYIRNASKFDFYNVKAKSPKNESVDDAWKDMSVYSVIGFLEKLGVWGR